MIEIRRFKPEDRDAVRQICIDVSSNPQMPEADRLWHYYLYNDYYTKYEPEHVFVAVDGDSVIGYVMASADPVKYRREMEADLLPKTAEVDESKAKQALKEMDEFELFSQEYQGHLHIDVLKEYQGQQVGTRLMKALIEQLQAEKVSGLMLGVSSSRPQAISFYKKQGFAVLDGNSYGYTMGIRL